MSADNVTPMNQEATDPGPQGPQGPAGPAGPGPTVSPEEIIRQNLNSQRSSTNMIETVYPADILGHLTAGTPKGKSDAAKLVKAYREYAEASKLLAEAALLRAKANVLYEQQYGGEKPATE